MMEKRIERTHTHGHRYERAKQERNQKAADSKLRDQTEIQTKTETIYNNRLVAEKKMEINQINRYTKSKRMAN